MCENTQALVWRIFCLILLQTCLCEDHLRGPPKVEDKPNLLDSFVPASMQIIAHLTELMKYDVKPPAGPATTTTTTVKPTPSHKPAIFAPQNPPGAAAYFARIPLNYEDYLKRLQEPSSYINYFDRYYYIQNSPNNNPLVAIRQPLISQGRLLQNVDEIKEANEYIGKGFAEVLRLANRIDPDFNLNKDEDVVVQDFSKDFDDSDFRFELLRQKKVPPTKAYVTLLSLYDMLNKESKRLGLNKYQGYTDGVLKELSEASSGTSAYQLRTVLQKVVERRDTDKGDIIKKINNLIKDLDEDNSYINQALRYIPPLPFAL